MAGLDPSVHGPPASLDALRGGEVHLWWGRIGDVESLDASRGWLSDEERRRSERFHHPRDARAFRFRRAFRRVLLARYAGCRPDELVFVPGAFGKPALAEPHEPLAFNASSRAGTVLLGVTMGRAIGVDLEPSPSALVADPEEIARLARQVATPAERRRLTALPGGQRARAFLELWTRKESLLKGLGTGLARDPATLEVGWGAEAVQPGVLGPDREARWLATEPPAGILASAVVAARPGETIRVRTWGGRGPGGLWLGSVGEEAGLEPGGPGARLEPGVPAGLEPGGPG